MRRFFPILAAVVAAAAFLDPSGDASALWSAKGAAHRTESPFASDGTAVDAWLPPVLHMRNTGGSDGAGLCVFTTIEMIGRACNIRPLFGYQKFMTRRPGGGWPEKVDDTLTAFCREQGSNKPTYFHVEANNLALLKKALRSGRLVGITYNYSPTGRYGGSRISHMVNLAAAGAGKGPDGKGWWAVLDNNFPGSWEWMSESQFLSVAAGGGRLWAVIFAAPACPPAPRH